jgi:putative transposase
MLFIGQPLSNDSQVITHLGLVLAQLEAFEAEWGKRYPAIGQAWRRAWEHVVPFFAFPPAVRKMIYTTNAVESLNRSLRKIIKTRGSFPTDEAALKLLFLVIRNAGVHWRRPNEWTAAVGQFAILFGYVFEPSARFRLKTMMHGSPYTTYALLVCQDK